VLYQLSYLGLNVEGRSYLKPNRGLKLPVNIPTMADDHHINLPMIIINLIDDAIIPDANSPQAISSGESNTTARPRLMTQPFDFVDNTPLQTAA
jgi:hypothetical protein